MDIKNVNLASSNVLKWVIILALIAGSYSAFIYTKAYSDSNSALGAKSFNVRGEGKVTVVPDVATFNFGVNTEGAQDIASAQKENTEKMNSIIDFLKNSGIDDEDIKTTSYNIYPRYERINCFRAPCPSPQISGYNINQSVEVKIRDFDNIGKILSGVVNEGANNVSSLRFTVDDPKQAESEARGLAIKNAEEQAEIIAKTAGFRLGDILSVDEYYVDPYFGRAYGMGGDMIEAKALSAPEVNIEAGSQEVVINVNVRYQIK